MSTVEVKYRHVDYIYDIGTTGGCGSGNGYGYAVGWGYNAGEVIRDTEGKDNL